MGIFSGNSNDDEPTSLESIKATYYDKKKENSDCGYYSLLAIEYSHFCVRLSMYFENKDLRDLKEAVKNSDKKDLTLITQKMNEIINEVNDLKTKAYKENDFYLKLISNLGREDRKRDNSYKKACEEIIENRIKSYIIYEKKLILLKDKIKEISLLI